MLQKRGEENSHHEQPIYNKTSRLRLIFIGCIVMMPLIPPGMTMSFSAIALPQMSLDLDQSSWFASISSIVCPLGNFVSGAILDKYGRRPSFFVSVIPNIVGWLLLVDPNASIAILYLGRILTGFSLGAASLPPVVYAAECITINDHNMRGSVSVWSTVAIALGTLITYSTAAILPYYLVALVGEYASLLSFVLLLVFVPESPAWLYRQGRIGDAEVAQMKLGIKQPILQQHWRADGAQTRRPPPPPPSQSTATDLLNYVRLIERREVYKPLAITVVFFFFSQFSGIYCLTAYMVDIISIDAQTSISPYTLTVVSGVLQTAAITALTFILPLAGVKPMACVSAIGVGCGFALLAVSEWLTLNYVHIAAVWFVVISANLGLMGLPYAVLGEMFPMEAKGYASLSLVASSIFNFVAIKLFPYAYDAFASWVFFAFTALNMCCVAFVVLSLPETVGKTMEEIESGFNGQATKGDVGR